MPDIEHIPQVRFEGFADAWKKRRLGCLAKDTHGGGTPQTSKTDFWKGNIPWIQSSDLQEGKLSGVIPNKHISEQGLRQSAAQLIPRNSIAIVTRVGVGKLALMPFSYTTSQDFMSLSRLTIQPWFGVYSIYQKLLGELHSVQGTAIKGMTKEDLLDKIIFCPRMDAEQKKIGNFFRALDFLITLHQQKYDKLVNLKAAMLEKMFPKDGTDVPEVRFAGFTDAWEQRNLGSVYAERNERGNKNLPILSVSIHTGVSSGELSCDALGKQVRRSEDKSLYKHVIAGDLVFNMMRAWQGAIGVSNVEGMVSPAYITAASTLKLDSDFMDCTVKRKDIVNQMDNLSYGVTDFRKRLYWDSFIRVFCYLPKEPEQSKIGTFFRTLDELISLHKRKLEKLRNVKQACLEKMFIS